MSVYRVLIHCLSTRSGFSALLFFIKIAQGYSWWMEVAVQRHNLLFIFFFVLH